MKWRYNNNKKGIAILRSAHHTQKRDKRVQKGADKLKRG